jgi:hypothetical protein
MNGWCYFSNSAVMRILIIMLLDSLKLFFVVVSMSNAYCLHGFIKTSLLCCRHTKKIYFQTQKQQKNINDNWIVMFIVQVVTNTVLYTYNCIYQTSAAPFIGLKYISWHGTLCDNHNQLLHYFELWQQEHTIMLSLNVLRDGCKVTVGFCHTPPLPPNHPPRIARLHPLCQDFH